jgi:FecR protein
MRDKILKITAGFFLTSLFAAATWAGDAPNPGRQAVPGTVNYVEGQVALGSQSLDSKAVGSAEVGPGQSLTTGTGKAEVLLMPGVFLRLGDNSAVKMVSAGLTNTEVEVDQGEVTVEVTQIFPQNNLRVDVDGAQAQLLKRGFYAFNAAQNEVKVFDGKASVLDGNQRTDVNGGHELALTGNAQTRTQKFDKNTGGDDLVDWSSLRSSYVAEANVDAAPLYVASAVNDPAGWFGTGWYWDPWFGTYTFIPADGILYSPFGWGFYSPAFVLDSPFFFDSPHRFRHFGPSFQTWGPGPHYYAGYTGRAHGYGTFHPGFVGGAPDAFGFGGEFHEGGGAPSGAATSGGHGGR